MKRTIIGLALLAATTGTAPASDIYGGSTKDGASHDNPQVVNWSGVYLGGRLGYGHANHDITVEGYRNGIPAVTCETAEPSEQPVEDAPVAKTLIADDCTPSDAIPGESAQLFGLNGLDTSGVTGGGQLGFDLQRGRFVFGIVGSYDLSGAETTVSLGSTEIKAIEKGDEWSLGARAGLLVNPRTLAYILAAYTESEFSFAGIGDNGGTKDITFSGLTVGGGIEFAVTNNIFLGIEGTHTFYGEEKLFDTGNGEPGETGLRGYDEIGETKVMGTMKVKFGNPIAGALN